ncbi:MAG: hypothetical protein ABL955_07025 [Elusimicrobiota bacterium]
MRLFEVYLYAAGTTFDVEQFQSLLPATHRGEVRPVYRMDGSEKKVMGRYWRSKSGSVCESGVDEAAMSQLRDHAAALDRARALGAENIYLSLAMLPTGEVSHEDVVLSDAVMRRLDAIGAEVDMNIPQL